MDGKESNRSADHCTCPFPFVSGSLSPFPFPSLPFSISLPSSLRAIIIINLVPHVELSVLVLSVPSVLSVLVLSAVQG